MAPRALTETTRTRARVRPGTRATTVRKVCDLRFKLPVMVNSIVCVKFISCLPTNSRSSSDKATFLKLNGQIHNLRCVIKTIIKPEIWLLWRLMVSDPALF